MINRKQITAGTVAAFGLFVFGAPALADFYAMAPNKDVDLCVAEVQENADYSDAGRVRHEIESSKRRTVGYSLEIETSVYGANKEVPIREYKAVCVVTGGKKPLQFSIRQKRDGA
jgi:hypothetical protein